MSGDTILNGRYRLIAQQGSGGMAVIYKAIDQELGRTVAIKILRPSLTADPTFIARFQNEARSIANLGHPNIVTVFDVGRDGPTNYIVMEFVEGQDLKKIIRAHGALPIERALGFAIGICAGLGYAHRAGIVHADVKPQNILLTREDMVKITDFGIAQALSDTQPAQRQSVVWGSPHYFAPEQAQGEKPTAASDVYSIGIVLFEMLTGRLPYTGANQQELAMAHIREPVPSPRDFNPAVSESLARIVMKVMSKNPSDRYRTADQLGQILVSYRDRGRGMTVSGDAVHDEPPPTLPSTSPPVQQPRPSGNPVQGHPLPNAQNNYPRSIPMPPEALPTQRYSSAPEAPRGQNYQQRPAVPSPTDSRPMQAGYNNPQSGQYTNRYPYNQELRQEDSGFELDAVTIALAFLAFMSVACLVPLYIAVLQARLG